MRRATHFNYKHPKHLRVEEKDRVLCVAPSVSDYAKLRATKGIKDYLTSKPKD